MKDRIFLVKNVKYLMLVCTRLAFVFIRKIGPFAFGHGYCAGGVAVVDGFKLDVCNGVVIFDAIAFE